LNDEEITKIPPTIEDESVIKVIEDQVKNSKILELAEFKNQLGDKYNE